MNLKRSAAMAVLAIGAMMLFSGCGLRVSFNAEASPTSPPTRTPRATFTPRPLETDTPIATDTPQVTDTPQPSDTSVPPTKKPVQATAKPKPATQPPQPTLPPATAAPTKSPFQYLFAPLTCSAGDGDTCNIQSGGIKCLHSGGHWIDVYVASDYRDANSLLAGIKVRYAFQPGGAAIPPDETTQGDGKAEKTLSANSDPPGKNVGTYYSWVIDNGGNRISDYSPAININAKSDSDPATCWAAKLAFAGGH
jgi:hypothetical protein